jgi:hypothetical protein
LEQSDHGPHVPNTQSTGTFVGAVVGDAVGDGVGVRVGAFDGAFVGASVGIAVGTAVGSCVTVGWSVGFPGVLPKVPAPSWPPSIDNKSLSETLLAWATIGACAWWSSWPKKDDNS